MDNTRLAAQQTISQEFDLPAYPDKVDFINHFAIAINALILHDFPKLVHILYRIDISEEKLKELLTRYVHDDAGFIIAQLIMERQMEKVKTKMESKKDTDISPEDQWN